MKKLALFLIMIIPLFIACEYDDSDLKRGYEELVARLVILESQCKKTNEEIQTLKVLIEAYNEKDFLTSINIIGQDGEEIGYELIFEKNGRITIYKGIDTFIIPQISIRQAENGYWYWTIRIEEEEAQWIVDDKGDKVSAMPVLKIEDGRWMLSIDGGVNWKEVGQATGEKGETGAPGESVFDDVLVNEKDQTVTFYLKDGNTIRIPLNSFSIVFSEIEEMMLSRGETIEIDYTITGITSDELIYIKAVIDSDLGVRVEIIPSDYKSGILKITAPYTSGYASPFDVVLVVTDNDKKSLIRVFSFEERF